MRLAVACLAAALAVPGCSLVEEPSSRAVEGRTDGYLATAPYLKVYVRSNDSDRLLLVDFERRDWHVAGIAERLDASDVAYLTVQATPRSVIGEYLVESVLTPPELESYRYESMQVSAEERAALDAEYDALLARLAEAAPAPSAAPTPPIQFPAGLGAP